MDSIDRRNRFDEEIFTYKMTKNKKVFISFQGRHVTTLAGKVSEEFLSKIQSADFKSAQLLMAKATGNFSMEMRKITSDLCSSKLDSACEEWKNKALSSYRSTGGAGAARRTIIS